MILRIQTQEEIASGYLRSYIEQHIKRGDDREFTKRIRDKLRFDPSLSARIAADTGLPLQSIQDFRDRLRDLSPKVLAQLAIALAIYE